MKQLTATHPSGQMTIIQRFHENKRFLKVIPATLMPMIVKQLTAQFKDHPIEVLESNTGWVRITKLDKSEKLEEQAKKITDEEELTPKKLLALESEKLREAGFHIKVEDI